MEKIRLIIMGFQLYKISLKIDKINNRIKKVYNKTGKLTSAKVINLSKKLGYYQQRFSELEDSFIKLSVQIKEDKKNG